MVDACPVTSETVNNTVVRIVAGFVVAISVVFLITAQAWLFYLLAVDFLIRALGHRKYSPLASLGRALAAALRFEPQPVNAAPKQFAAKIGFGFALVAATLALLGLDFAARVVAAGLLGAASLEAFFGFCVGCMVYSWIPRAEPKEVQSY